MNKLIKIAALCALTSPIFGQQMTAEFIYETAPFPSCHAATIEETPRGIILLGLEAQKSEIKM